MCTDTLELQATRQNAAYLGSDAKAPLAGDAGGLSVSIYDLRASLVSSAALKTLTANQPPQRHASLYAIEQTQ